MRAVKDILNNIKPKEPIFFARGYEREGRIDNLSFSTMHNNIPQFVGEINNNQQLIELTLTCLDEQYNGEIFTIDQSNTLKRVKRRIDEFVLEELMKIMPQKQPRETKMFKWFRDTLSDKSYHNDIYNPLVHLYNYVLSNGRSEETNKNTLAILTVLYNKNS